MMGAMRPLVPPPVLLAAGLLAQRAAVMLAAGSVAVTGVTVRQFFARETTVHPLHPEHASALVVDGPNAFTRNPMYVGMAGVLLAHALGLGRWRAVLPAAAVVAVIDRVQVQAEERALEERFGEDYAAYRARVPRWVGPVRPR
jgi:protein-S-isoprenylcysteine O-methyltransferase Ste14